MERRAPERASTRSLVGMVAGDMHDLGKNIFKTYAKCAGLEIVDLGTDVSAEQFADAFAPDAGTGTEIIRAWSES